MQSEYCIGVIAVKDTNILQLFPFIIHNGVKYKLLDVSFKSLTTDVRRCAEFNFKPISYHYDEDNVYLGLFFQPQHSTILNRNILSKYRIIKQFFDINIPQAISVDDGQSMVAGTTKANTMPSVSELYAMLRDAHERNPVNEEVAPVMPSYFVPELRSYQLKGLRWMLNRERSIKYSPPEYVPVRCPRIPNKMFYYNYRTVELKDHDPGSLKIPTGGILADEMGLGKTVEMLALILTNRNLKRKRTSSSMTETVPVKKLGAKEILRCICIKSKRHNAIQCKNCLYFQHVSCVAKYSQKPIVNYICPECWKLEPLVDSSTTFIVSPTSIKMQWNEEIVKHIANDNVRVLIYNGIKNSGWISPNDLKNYDIVLTDYNIMKAEMYYPSSTQQERSSRSERRYTIPSSPLTMVKWWRVVLDEAQMVETPKNNCSKMVKSLAAVHRWAVTGTPIEKSIDNLFGLLYFLDYVPFSDPTIWKNLSVAFNQGDIEPLIDQCLKNVMWRTCKVNVWQEIGLLPQTEIIHRITMSDSEALYYKDQHSQCANAFLEKVHKLNKSLSMFKMNPKTLNK
ncbi:E3 ubiquitin-protein ligase SHPRH, partial [Pseudolycoriella hygida]